jgi:type II secretory pathway pseudopilin PulG
MRCQNRSQRCSQQGYIMMALTLATALILIALTAGLPALSVELRREREQELIHRGAQYQRAIRNYYRKFGAYSTSLEQLEDTNHLRFLRKRYKDPMTGADFRLLHLGEIKLSLQPSGTASADASNQAASQASSPDATPSDAQPPALSSPFTSIAKGPTIGGGPIAGVTSTSDQQSLHVFDGKDHYNEWQFIFVPALDRGGLPSRPYDGFPAFGIGQAPGATSAGQKLAAP